jgi:Putative esterase
LRSLHDVAVARWDEMKTGKAPPMIWVGLDQSSPTGTSEFVNSVNNGPWGQALTAELIPDLERQYRMDAKPSGRLLTGHSSGGWAVLWLQVNYPKLFGGAWPTSPDPSDFHDFLGINLYAPNANVYRKPDGTPWPLARDKNEMLVAVEDFTRREVVVGEYGGQMASFEWVFSPRGAGGLPVPMFDRTTGAVDSVVIAYWKEHYDVAERLRRHWPELRRDLDGKIQLTVGSADTFYLDGAAHLLEATMKGLGAKTEFRYVEGRSHSTSTPWPMTTRACTRPSHGRCTRTPGRDQSRRPSAPLRPQFRPAERARVGPAAVILVNLYVDLIRALVQARSHSALHVHRGTWMSRLMRRRPGTPCSRMSEVDCFHHSPYSARVTRSAPA